MQLFIIENQIVRPNLETLVISPFKEIWERDITANKGKAIREFTYVEFMCSLKKSNPFKGYDEIERASKIIQHVFYGDNFEPDELIIKALDVYRDFQYNSSPSIRFYNSAVNGAKKLQDFFDEFDMNERNSKDIPIYKPAEITRALKDTIEVLRTLKSLEQKVEEEMYDSLKTRANKDINMFER